MSVTPELRPYLKFKKLLPCPVPDLIDKQHTVRDEIHD